MKTAFAKERTYVPRELAITWELIEPIFQELATREINNKQELEKWLTDRSELDGVLQEDYAWRYIRMTCDTANEQYSKDFQYFATEIEPKMAPILNDLDKKLMKSPSISTLDRDKYFIYLRKVEKSLEIFREENIPLFTEIQLKQQEYQTIAGGLTVEIDGKEMTLQQASNILLVTDRPKREAAWQAITDVRLQKKEELDEIFNRLVELRHQVAINAGFDNYRDYMFVAMGRFDYTVKDCQAFHQAVAQHVVPVLQRQADDRREKLGFATLQPWDMQVDPDNLPPLMPFKSGKELIDKTETIFETLHPYMGQCIRTMQDNKLFDVESRIGKAPGGYNYPLYESGAPFIFMNSTGTMRDLTTMVHEGGHAIHTFITADLELNDFKNVPSEVAELASMSMELLSMDEWNHFFADEKELARAKKQQLEDVLSTLPWVATVDKFQHWIYTHPDHTVEERNAAWIAIYREFGHGHADWSAHPVAETYLWHKQLHIFEVPFYYIEYGFAQLGAIAIWRNYKQGREKAIEQYLAALKLGYTRTIGDIYETAGVKFDFSPAYIQELISFVEENY